jgi:hypothetical protein
MKMKRGRQLLGNDNDHEDNIKEIWTISNKT